MTYELIGGYVHTLFLDMLGQSHLLIAGASGSGKSVLVNGLICTALHYSPFDVPNGKQLILIDPKRTELHPYRRTPHCLRYASEPEDMVDALHYAIGLTEQRYKRMHAENWRTYRGGDVYVIIEELADLMTTRKREVQPLIQRLCQIARAAKIHLVAVTQCPLVAVIPTPIKCNFDGIVALRTRSAQDSRNIIGVKGAELLPRYGECLYLTPDRVQIEHCKIPYINEQEQERVVRWWTEQVDRQQASAPRGFWGRLFGR